jgi:hypothetical protein
MRLQNEGGGVFLLTLVVLLTITGFFIWLLYDYERERVFLENQTELLALENALQLAMMEVINDPTIDDEVKEYPMGTVIVKKSGGQYEMYATLVNGAERKAFLTVDENGHLLHYQEGI